MKPEFQNNDVILSFEKLSRDELIDCFQGLKEDFKTFADNAFVESYATKLATNADFVAGKWGGVICCLIAFYTNKSEGYIYFSRPYN